MGFVCLWGKIKKGGREAEKEGDIREIGKKCLERKRKCNILNIYLENVEKSSYVLGSELWESKFDGLLAILV